MDQLQKYRNEIDNIDKQITELFEKRMDKRTRNRHTKC